MSTSTRIRRNTKRFREVFSKATEARSYTLENCFRGELIENLTWVREQLPKEAFESAEVYDDGEGKFTVHFHSNHWIEISHNPIPPENVAAWTGGVARDDGRLRRRQ